MNSGLTDEAHPDTLPCHRHKGGCKTGKTINDAQCIGAQNADPISCRQFYHLLLHVSALAICIVETLVNHNRRLYVCRNTIL